MPLKLINAGGSVTLSVAVLAALWAVRSIRAASRQRRAAAASLKSLDGTTCTPKYLCTLSPASVALLVHLQAVPCCILDVRTADQAAANPLPGWLASAVHVPVHLLSSALSPPHSAWFTSTSSSSSSSSGDNASAAATARPDPPTHHHLLVILAFDDDQGSRAAGWAAAAGYDRVATIAGGVKQFLQYSSPTATDSAADTAAYLGQPAAAAAGVAAGAQLPGLHRDALALLLDLVPLPESAYELCSSILGLNIQQQQQQQQNNVAAANSNAQTGTPGKSSRLLVIDVRRHDERTLYGAIPGVMHIPVDELAAALQLPAATFRRRYHDDPPVESCDVVVTTSRGNKRARWAAQVAADAGLDNVYIHLDGTYGWRFSPAVEVYESYQQWESPPDPENFTICQPDVAAGAAELQQLGLLHLLLQQRSMR